MRTYHRIDCWKDCMMGLDQCTVQEKTSTNSLVYEVGGAARNKQVA